MKFSNSTIAEAIAFFFKPLILEAIKKQKLLNEEDYILFIDSTNMKISPNANKNGNSQEQNIGRSK